MANIVGLALKVNADATGLRLDPAERALKKLGEEANKVTKVFDQFTKDSVAATDAQKRFTQDLKLLDSTLKNGLITAKEYAEERAKIVSAANEEAEALRRAAEITARYEPEIAKFTRTQAELRTQLESGRITQDTYNRAVEDAARKLTDAERAAAGLAARSRDIAASGSGATLQFNELSGILSVLPGPLGSIAGRLSGVTSASQGLARVFSGGLAQGVTSIGSSVAALVNPFTAAAAAIIGVGAAAQQVVAGLNQLDDRVEKLGNLATQLGTSFEFVQVLEEAGQRTGVSIESVSGAMTRLQSTLAGADEESKRATKALDNLGVSVEQLDGLSEQGKIELLAQQLGEIEDPVKRTAAAVQLFGRSGTQLLPFFRELGGAANDLQRFGAAITDEDKSRIDGLGASLDALNVAARGFSQGLLTPFIGITRSIREGLAPAITALAQNFGALFDALSPITSAIGSAINVLLQLQATISRVIGTALEPSAAVGRLVSGVFDRMSQSFTAVFSAINRVVDSFRNLFRFESAAQRLSQLFTDISDAISTRLAPIFERLSAVAQRVGVILQAAFERVSAAVASFANSTVARIGDVIATFLRVTGVTDAVSAAAERIGQVFGSAWEIVRGVVSTIGELIEEVLQFAERWLGITATIAKPVEATIEVNTGDTINELIAENKELGKVIDEITKSVGDAKLKSVEFGQAGFDAAVRFEEGITDLKDRLARGFFNEETFTIEAEKARVAFNAELERISEDARLEIQIEQDAARTLAGLQQQINDVIVDSARLGQAGFDAALQYQDAIGRLQEQFERGIVNETTLAAEARKVRLEYDAQVQSIEAATRAQQQQIDNDRKRIESLLQVNNVAQRITDDIASVDREIARVQEEFARAVEEFDGAAAINAQRRIAELDLLQRRLSNDLQAAAQGFEQGFDKAFAASNQNIERLTEQANRFGDAGADAARRLQEGIAAAQEQAKNGVLTREAFEAEVRRREELFTREIEQVRQVADERKRVNEFVDQQFLLARFGGDQQRLAAAQRVAEIEREIIRVQGDVQVARAAGNQQAVNEGIQRLGLLDQVAAKERDIASGRKQAEEQVAQARQQYLQQLAQQQKAAEAQQQKFAEERAKAVEAETQRQAARIRELNTLGAGVIGGRDIRTSEGAAQFLRLAANRQDPALIEARLQTRRLTELRDAVVSLSRTFAGPVVQIGAGVG